MEMKSIDMKSLIDTRRKGSPDAALFIILFLLIGIGIAMSYSASAMYSLKTMHDSFYYLKKQLVWFAAGFMMLLVFQEIDYRIYARYTKPVLVLSLILLIAVFVPGVGHHVKGSVRWIGYGFARFQPSEFVKIFLVIYLVKVFSSEKKGTANHVMQLLVPMAVFAVMFILVMMQPDFGSAVVLLIVFGAVLFMSGFPAVYILSLVVLSVPMFYLLIYQVEYRRERIFAYLNPWHDRYGIGYHIVQSFIAFKKGGFFGVGLGNGTQKLSRLPEPHTDFIFAVIAEETGFLGTVSIILLFCLFMWRGMKIACEAPDDFGRLLAVGLTVLIVGQAFINISVVTGNLPTTGITLPFISYGGSSLMASMAATGVLLNISRYREAAHKGLKTTQEVTI